MFSIVVNIHRNILSADCYINCDLQNRAIDNIIVIVTKTHFSVTFHNDRKLIHNVNISTPNNFFIPSSVLKKNNPQEEMKLEDDILTISQHCHNFNKRNSSKLQILEKDNSLKNEENICISNCEKRIDSHNSDNKVEISFRIQISDSGLISMCSSDVQNSPLLCDFFKRNVNCDQSYEVICTNCDKQLSNHPVSFQRIEEYCDNSGDLSESWYCHKNVLTEVKLQDNSLYVGATHIYLKPRISKAFFIDHVHPNKILCKTCKVLLGASRTDLEGFYAEALMFKKPDSAFCNVEEYRHKVVLISLWNIIDKKSYICRLLFQSKVDDINASDHTNDPCLLLWISPTKIAQFKLQSTLSVQSTQLDFTTQDVFKVQYYAGSYSSPQVQVWKKDFNVDFYLVGNAFLNTLKRILISSTESMVDSNKGIKDDFSTGCLPCSYPGL